MAQYIIFGKDNCPNCTKAESILKFKSIVYTKKMLGVDYELQELYEIAGYPVRSLPYIIKGGESIGSVDDLIKHLKN